MVKHILFYTYIGENMIHIQTTIYTSASIV